MTIDKSDPNIILINIIKLKLYRFVKNHTLQRVLAKLCDFLLEEPVEATHFDKLFIKQPMETTHFDNLFTKQPV
jgi:hypothetical protein